MRAGAVLYIALLASPLFAQNAAAPTSGVRSTQTEERRLRASLAAHPDPQAEASIRLQLAKIYQLSGDWLKAAGELAELRKLAPADPEFAYQLGAVFRNASRDALVQMQSAAPASARVQQLEAEQLASIGEIAKATDRYRRAIASDPSLRGSHLGLAMLYARAGKHAEAIAELDAELAIAPQSAVARQLRQSIAAP